MLLLLKPSDKLTKLQLEHYVFNQQNPFQNCLTPNSLLEHFGKNGNDSFYMKVEVS